MYGAILGDIIGRPYEFDRSPKVKDYKTRNKGGPKVVDKSGD